MITVMRRYRRILQIGLLVVIAAFVLTSVYVGSMSGGSRNRGDIVATVNGEAIPVERYQRRYQAYLDAYSRVYRDRFSPTLAEQLQAVPAFAENGRFSLARYQDFLRRRGVSASAFENDVRRELTRMKVETTVKAGIKVSDPELERAFALRREEVRAAWALVETAPLLAAAAASDEEVAEYLKAHPAEFQLPERRRVQYVTLAPKDFRPQIPDAEVEKYYTEHAKDFETPRQVHAAHVLVVVPQTGGSEAEDKARRAKADEVKPTLQGAKDFVAEARRLGLTPIETTMSKTERIPMLGGSDPLEEAAFALAVGGVSSPVKTPAGWVVLKSSEAIAAGVPPLAEIRDKVMGVVKRQKAEAVALERAQKLAAAAATNDLTAAAKSAGAQTGETARFSRGKPAERLPGDVQLAALQSPAGAVAGPVKSPQGYYVLKVLERIAPNMADLAAERDRLSREVLTQKQSQAWEAWVSHARAAAKVEVLAAPKRS